MLMFTEQCSKFICFKPMPTQCYNPHRAQHTLTHYDTTYPFVYNILVQSTPKLLTIWRGCSKCLWLLELVKNYSLVKTPLRTVAPKTSRWKPFPFGMRSSWPNYIEQMKNDIFCVKQT